MEFSPRRSDWPLRRTPEIIRTALLAVHDSAESKAMLDRLRAVQGPYTSIDGCLEACNAWAVWPGSQGRFHMCVARFGKS